MILNLLATLVLAAWAMQGLHLTKLTRDGGYSPVWIVLVGLSTLALALPLLAVWL